MRPVGLRPEKDCAGNAHQKLKTTDLTSHQRGRPTSINPYLSKKKLKKERRKIGCGSQTPRQAGQLTVDHNITSLDLDIRLLVIVTQPVTNRGSDSASD
jgi:hypothetical protein